MDAKADRRELQGHSGTMLVDHFLEAHTFWEEIQQNV